mmetsp:Transcript_4041/g.12746  ORF Transcript_4041/g.12746 Transcript_4041/m.12746 type:complete len:373 (+) Transcript_4041:627-1745(+)
MCCLRDSQADHALRALRARSRCALGGLGDLLTHGREREEGVVAQERHVLAKLDVGPVQVVEQPQRAVVDVEVLVVKVVLLWTGQERKMVARVRNERRADCDRRPEHEHDDVATCDERPQGDGNQVAENVLDGVGVHGSDRNRRGPLVVDLVDMLVQKREVMRKAMRVVKPDLFARHDHDQVPRDAPGIGVDFRRLVRIASSAHRVREQVEHDGHNDELIHGHAPNRAPQLGAIERLVRARLHLEAPRPRRLEEVEHEECAANRQVHEGRPREDRAAEEKDHVALGDVLEEPLIEAADGPHGRRTAGPRGDATAKGDGPLVAPAPAATAAAATRLCPRAVVRASVGASASPRRDCRRRRRRGRRQLARSLARP